MARVLVLGAGFGGVAAATRLRSLLPGEHDVVVVDRRSEFVMGLRKTWAVVGEAPLGAGGRALAALGDHGIDVRTGTIDSIDPAGLRARVDGDWIEADALIVALGAELVPAAIPGFAEHAIDVWDRAGVGPARDALARLEAGRLLIGVFGLPYACPPGPFELAFLAHESLRARGANVSVEIFGPMPIALPVLGPVESGKVEALLEDAGIKFHRAHVATSVDRGVVHLADGRDLAFDVLLGVPPHRCPQILVDAGLAKAGGWVEVDPRTLATTFPNVYAIGDATIIKLANGLPLPKAGIFAEAEGHAVAERLASELAGQPPSATFDGTGTCYSETGGGRAIEIDAGFFADPPQARILGPSLAAMAGKRRFETDRLAAWFGP